MTKILLGSVLIFVLSGLIWVPLAVAWSQAQQTDIEPSNLVFSGDTFPSSPSDGQVFYRSDLDEIYLYENSVWEPILKSRSISLDDLYFDAGDPVTHLEWGSLQGPASYTVFTNVTHAFMKNETTGQIEGISTDGAEAIQWAIGNLTTGRTWKEKIVVKGNFVITFSIVLDNYTILDLLGAELIWNIGTAPDHIITVNGKSQVTVLGGAIDADYTNHPGVGLNKHIIHIENSSYVSVENCKLINAVSGGHGIWVTSSDNVLIDGVESAYCGDDEIAINGSDDVIVVNCIAYDTRDDPSTVAASGIEVDDGGQGVIIANNVVYNSETGNMENGIDVHTHAGILMPTDVAIVNNVVHNTKAQGIGIRQDQEETFGKRYVVANNIIYSIGVGDGRKSGIELIRVEEIIVEGNTIKDIILGSEAFGIFVGYGSRKYTLLGNTVVGSNHTGINLWRAPYGVCSNNIVANNGVVGIYLRDDDTSPYARHIIVSGNLVYDDAGVQDYGIYLRHSADYNIVTNNILYGNLVVQAIIVGTNNIIGNNIGFITENSGNETIANNEYIAHGLAGTPDVVTVTSRSVLYDSVTFTVGVVVRNSTHFQVGCYWTNGTAITADAIWIDWYGEYKP